MDTLNQSSLSTAGIVYSITPNQERLNYIYDVYTSAYGIWFPYFFGLFAFINTLIMATLFAKAPSGKNFITTEKDALIVKLILGGILTILVVVTIVYGILYRNLTSTIYPTRLYKVLKTDRLYNIIVYTISPIFILIYIYFAIREYKKAKL